MIISGTITLATVIPLAQQLIALIGDVKGRIVAFKDDLESLQLTLTFMEPLFKGRDVDTSCSNQKVLKKIIKKLNKAKVLVEKCDKLPSRSIIRKCRYSRKISNLDARLFRLYQQVLMAQNSCAIKLILNNLEELSKTLSATLALTPEKLEKLSTLVATLQGDEQGSETHLASGPVFAAWTRPPNGFLKYNVNGVCHGNPAPAGIGGVCRDANGTFINCFHKGVGYSNALEAEALAIREGLLVAADRGHLRIYIESSCEMIINILTQFGAASPGGLSSSISLECPTEISFIITEILNLQDSFQEVFFCHTLKEGNYVAASLSSTAATLQSPGTLDFQPPNSIASTLYSDACGACNLCLV